MANFAFRIKTTGAAVCSESLTFAELRELLHAGLIDGDTRLADDEFAYHALKAYPVLWDALHDPTVVDVERSPVSRLAPREEVARERDINTAAPILDPTEADLIDFEAVRRGERGFSTLDLLALNRVNEPPPKPVRWPPFYRKSRMVDLRRWLFAGSPLIVIIVLTLWKLVEAMRTGGAELLVAAVAGVFGLSFLFLMLLWGYFFLIDYHYPGKE
jgi:hypothetical protein